MKKIKISVKPLSVNKCWQGRRYKTRDYKDYEVECMAFLPKVKIPEGGKQLEIKVGFSNMAQDLDNISKPLIDILQTKYNFNDREIMKIILEKVKVEKGDEFIEFKFSKFNN